ncbi:MAG: hypothetical protein AB1631_29775, partial [Acidobacteriota bacterium]
KTYSRIRPQELVKDIDTDGTGVLSLASLTSFEYDFSAELKIEYPISTSGEPNYIDRRDWFFHRTPSLVQVRLLGEKPNGAANTRITYKAPHKIDTRSHEETDLANPPVAITTTIPDSDFEALCKEAACEACKMLANFYAQTGDPGAFVNADMSYMRSKSGEYAARAKELHRDFEAHMGTGIDAESDVAAASLTYNWDAESSLGTDRLTHKRRFR